MGRRITGIDWVWIVFLAGVVAVIVSAIIPRSPSDKVVVMRAMWNLHTRQSHYQSDPGPDGKPRLAYWLEDVAGLLRDVPPQLPGLAQADTTRGPATPYHGYYFRAFAPAADAYYAIVAYPADYGKTGKDTFFINGHGLFSKDLGGRVLAPGEFVRDGSWSIID